MKKYLLHFLLLLSVSTLALVSCNNSPATAPRPAGDTARVNGHPAWIMQGNIYEVNLRQYTPEGTIKAFEASLPRLKEMGVQTLWFMPINPISKADRKGSLGSYYAVSDYMQVNPEFGTMDDWKSLVSKCHDNGMKVIIDWVPNHTGADHYWLQKHPAFYVTDSAGHPVSQFDWTDTRKLNYHNPELQDSMIRCMKFWIDTTGIDGFRCDYAVGPTREFWSRCISDLKKDKNIFMLAEADSAWLYKAGFDATYGWNDFSMMKLIAKGKRKASDFDSAVAKTDTAYPANAIRLFFTSNHDENSWNHADYETMPGLSHAPFAVLTQTMKKGIPLIYSGQEEPILRAIRFFDKDTITFSKYQRADFYHKLLLLRKTHPALAVDGGFERVKTDKDGSVYAYFRVTDKDRVFVILNLSGKKQSVKLLGTSFTSEYMKDEFSGMSIHAFPTSYELEPWGYRVLTF